MRDIDLEDTRREPPEESPVAWCAACGGEIYAGEMIRKGDEGRFHKECLSCFLRDKIDEDDLFAQRVADELGYDLVEA